MKPTIKKQIESSQKGIDYVDSLMPTEQDCINVAKQQIEDVFINGIKNNIPETIAKLNRRKESQFEIFIWSMVAMGVILWTLGIIYLIKR